MNSRYLNVPAYTFTAGRTTLPGPELGLFRLRGYHPQAPVENHQFILTDIKDLGHRLLVHVFYGGRERLVIENVSEPASAATFSFKNFGSGKKKFKPGEILNLPDSYTLTWIAPNLQGRNCLVTLTLTPRFSLHGLRLFYALEEIA